MPLSAPPTPSPDLLVAFDLDQTVVHSTHSKEAYECEAELQALFAEAEPPAPPRRDPRGQRQRHFTVLVFSGLLIEVRPGIRRALKRISRVASLAVCTMAEPEYVNVILGALDPDAVLFGDRVLDRSHFPRGTKKAIPGEWAGAGTRALAIDDRPETWDGSTAVIGVDPFYGSTATTDDASREERRSQSEYLAVIADVIEQCGGDPAVAVERFERRGECPRRKRDELQSSSSVRRRRPGEIATAHPGT